MVDLMPVLRLPLTLRALLLVPILAVGVDQARATLACGPRAESCLEAAGQGWLGGTGIMLVALYAVALALGIGRLARGAATTSGRAPGLLRLWALGTLGVAAVCGGQAVIAGVLGAGGALGGGWIELALLCTLAGGAFALALRAAPAAVALVRALRPAAPRLRLAAALPQRLPAPPARRARLLAALAAPGRAPPALLA